MKDKSNTDFLEILKLWFEFAESLDEKDFSKEAITNFVQYLKYTLNKKFPN